jgi:hypothetical protein
MRSFVLIRRRRVAVCLLFILATCGLVTLASERSAFAQTITGAIRGTVVDPSGASIPHAQVTATNTATGVVSKTFSDKSGLYNFQFLPIGTYTVSSQASGFKTTAMPPFRLEVDQVANIPLRLEVGEASSTVTVHSAVTPILDTENATLGLTLSAGMIANIPLNGPNFSTLTQFLPGSVSPSPTGFTGAYSIQRDTGSSDVPSFNGNRQQTNNYLLDGADINESFSDDIGYNPSPEAIEQIKVITSNADAEYGNVNGGEILLSTKGGTNQFHGSLYDVLQNDNLNANTWANNFSHAAKSSYTQQVFGGTLGGPIFRNKLFFFGDYEGVRYHTGGPGTASVAPLAFRQGNFSLLQTLKGIQLYDSQNGFAPFANDQNVPVNNPVATFLFTNPSAYPLPNQTPTDGIAQNDYLGYNKSFIANNQGDVRIDYTVDSKDTLMGRFSMGDAYSATTHPVLAISFPTAADYPVWGGVINWTRVINSFLVNEARASFMRLGYGNSNTVDSTGLFGNSGNAKVGIPGGQAYAGFSEQVMSNGTIGSFGTTAGIYSKFDNNFLYADDLTWQHGRHITKFGAQFLRYQQNNFDPGNDGTLGDFAYNGAFTGDPAAGETTGYAFADFLLDYSSSAGVGGVRGFSGQRQWRDAYFVQDDWKLPNNITLNLGVRYEYDQPIYEVHNKMTNVNLDNPSLGKAGLEYAGVDGNSRALYNPTYNNFMPRIGFAWQTMPRFVIRGGYGSSGVLEGTGSSLRLTENAPWEYNYTAQATTPTTTSSGAPLNVTNGFGNGNVTAAQTAYFAWAKNLRPAITQQFSLTSEYELNNETSLQVGYVGETGRHLIVPIDSNEWTAPCTSSCTTAPFYNLVGQTGSVKTTASEAMSDYNALQIVLRHRKSHGFEYTINYTYAKSLSNNSGFYGVPGVNGASAYWQNAYDPSADYGPTGFDIRHNLTANGYYELPFGHGRKFGGNWNMLTNEALGGWKIAGNGTVYTGFPITISSNIASNTNALSARANRYGPIHVVDRSVQHWFGTDPSATPCSGPNVVGGVLQPCAYGAELPNTYGTAGVGTERGPDYREVDLSIFKTFAIGNAGQGLDFRADFFNAFNIASYADPTASVSSTSFGQITSTRSPNRQIQLSARYHF